MIHFFYYSSYSPSCTVSLCHPYFPTCHSCKVGSLAELPLIFFLPLHSQVPVRSGLPFDAKCSCSIVPFLDFWCWCKCTCKYCPCCVTQCWRCSQFEFFMFIVIALFISLLAFSEAQRVLAVSLLRSVPAVKRIFHARQLLQPWFPAPANWICFA